MMRINRIVAFDISHTHPGHKPYDTDSYYVKLANRLLDCFDKAHLDLGDATPNIMRYAAISLASYMEEMQQKQEALSRQNTQLQEAYDEAQEYDRLKANFVHQMTDQMVGPVDTVCRHTDNIVANYQTLTKPEMAKIQIDILSTTESITQLLGQLMK